MMNRLPFRAKHCMLSSLPHHGNEHQQSITNCWSCILGTEGIVWIFELISELLITLIGKNTQYHRKNTDYKIIDIAICKTCKPWSLDIEYAILIRHYYHTAKSSALHESRTGSAGQPTENPPNADGLGDIHRIVPRLTVCVYWRARLAIWQRFDSYPDPDLKWRSGTVAHTNSDSMYIWAG